MNKILKKNWQIKKLNEVSKIIMGQSPPSDTYNENAKGMPFFQGKAEFTDLYPVVKKYCSKPTKIAEPLDILLSVRAPVGTTNIANQQCCIGRGLAAIRFENYKYGFYFLRSIQHELDSKGTGTTFRAISGETIRETLIPFPNPETQQAIVSKIEELFSELDKGIEDLKTAQQQLKTYRQSVLKWAFEGKLTNENVKDGELPIGWKIAAINTVSSINPKLPNKENLDREMEVQFLPMKLVEEIINKIHLSDIKKLHEVLKGSYTPFIDNDIIFAKVTPCMENGKIAIVEKLKNGIGFGSSEFHVIRTNEKVSNKYMFYFLVQDRFRNEAANEMTGAVGLRRVPKQFIENYQIPIPSTEEQHLIVQEIESRLSVADKMEESIAQSLQQAEALRQSILKKAFSGELV